MSSGQLMQSNMYLEVTADCIVHDNITDSQHLDLFVVHTPVFMSSGQLMQSNMYLEVTADCIVHDNITDSQHLDLLFIHLYLCQVGNSCNLTCI